MRLQEIGVPDVNIICEKVNMLVNLIMHWTVTLTDAIDMLKLHVFCLQT